jgi:putative transposase
MWSSNPTWGAPRIQAELQKLGIDVSESTVRRYRPLRPRQPSQNSRSFLENWTARQVLEAFPYDTRPRFLLHDRDKIFAGDVARRVRSMAIAEVLTAP